MKSLKEVSICAKGCIQASPAIPGSIGLHFPGIPRQCLAWSESADPLAQGFACATPGSHHQPTLGHIKLTVHNAMSFFTGIADKNTGLTVLCFAQMTTVLPGNSYRIFSLFGKFRGVNGYHPLEEEASWEAIILWWVLSMTSCLRGEFFIKSCVERTHIFLVPNFYAIGSMYFESTLLRRPEI